MAATIYSSGCSTELEPFAPADITFTILGYLDTDADTQYVRIVPLRKVVQRDERDSIDARVTTTHIETGETETWTHNLIRFADSSYGHMFSSALDVRPGGTYNIDVRRSDGASASAQTRVPERPGDPDSVFGAQNESGSFAPLYWPGVTRVIDLDVTYTFVSGAVTFRYVDDDLGYAPTSTDWRIDLKYEDDRREISRIFGSGRLPLLSVHVRLATPSLDWEPPDGVWDRDVLIQPGTFSNVDGGLGWFGSVSRTTVQWIPSLIALRDLEYDYGG